MYLDVVDLKAFYSQPLGRLAQRQIERRIAGLWPHAHQESLLGIGYATPYLGRYRDDAERVIAFMPAAQGVINWPASGPSASALVLEDMLPLADASFDRALLVHSLEHTGSPGDLLREAWRVLAPGGKLLAIVPNRSGLWSRVETTPLGFGRPFSKGQLTTLLRDSLFVPNAWATALHVPPFSRSWLIRSAGAWERIGGRMGAAFAGVIVVEATKQLYQGVAERSRKRLVSPLSPVLMPQGSTRGSLRARDGL